MACSPSGTSLTLGSSRSRGAAGLTSDMCTSEITSFQSALMAPFLALAVGKQLVSQLNAMSLQYGHEHMHSLSCSRLQHFAYLKSAAAAIMSANPAHHMCSTEQCRHPVQHLF